jgi:hypothetical protein
MFRETGSERRDLLRSATDEPSLPGGLRLCPNCRSFSSRWPRLSRLLGCLRFRSFRSGRKSGAKAHPMTRVAI